MRTELKQAIINYIFDNLTHFQLNNATTEEFRAYIYDSKGYYLIGGEDISKFINQAINLITKN